MAAPEAAVRLARQAHNSKPLEVVTRTGFLGYGVFHLTVAWLALQLALGHPAGESDQAGAFRFLAGQPFGRVLLLVIIVGLIAMAVWQLLLAAVGHRDEKGGRRTAERLASLGRTIIYSALAWTAGKVVAGARPSSASQQEHVTAGVLAHPAGRILVALAGVAVLALGFGLLVYGVRKLFERRLMIARMSRRIRKTTVRLGQLGYAAKGFAFGVVGLLITGAAVDGDASRSRGLDAALRELVGKPYGVVLLALIAAGFAAFGVYCFFQSKYRKV
jgi:hypothetical protein